MKLFKIRNSVDEKDSYTILLDDLHRTAMELKNTYTNLGNAVEPDMIDYYIYQAKAMQIRYKFLLERLKQMENCCQQD